MTPTLTGQILASVECETTLDLTTDVGWFLTIENDYTFTPPGGPAMRTDAGEEDGIVAVLAGAIGTALESFEIGDDGSLSLGVANGVLSVLASDGFEAWSIVGPGKERIVSVPGGEVAVWR